MHIEKIIFDHIGPIEHEEIEPGAVTIFEGPNGSGKSLHLKAIRAALTTPKKGQDFTGLLGDDATHGYVSLSLNTGLNIRRDVSPADSPLSLSSKALGEKRGADANRYVTNTFDAEGVNCEAFLTKDKKERTKLILEAIPFRMDREGLRGIVGDGFDKLEGHPLEILDYVHKTFYDQRTEINRSAKERRQMAEGLAATIQSEVDLPQIDNDISRLESELQALEAERSEKIEHAEIAATSTIDKAEREHAVTTARLRAECQAKIDALKAQLAEEIAGEDKTLRLVQDYRRDITESVRSEADAIFLDKSTAVKLAIQGARTQRDAEVSAEAQRKIMQDGLRSASLFESQSKDLSGVLGALEEFKGNMLKELPIPGITMQDGEIFIDGKTWDTVPDSRLATLAIDLAIARTHESSILIVDKAESIDDHQFEGVIIPHLQRCGRQCFVGRASVGSPEHPIAALRVRKLPASERTEAVA